MTRFLTLVQRLKQCQLTDFLLRREKAMLYKHLTLILVLSYSILPYLSKADSGPESNMLMCSAENVCLAADDDSGIPVSEATMEELARDCSKNGIKLACDDNLYALKLRYLQRCDGLNWIRNRLNDCVMLDRRINANIRGGFAWRRNGVPTLISLEESSKQEFMADTCPSEESRQVVQNSNTVDQGKTDVKVEEETHTEVVTTQTDSTTGKDTSGASSTETVVVGEDDSKVVDNEDVTVDTKTEEQSGVVQVLPQEPAQPEVKVEPQPEQPIDQIAEEEHPADPVPEEVKPEEPKPTEETVVVTTPTEDTNNVVPGDNNPEEKNNEVVINPDNDNQNGKGDQNRVPAEETIIADCKERNKFSTEDQTDSYGLKGKIIKALDANASLKSVFKGTADSVYARVDDSAPGEVKPVIYTSQRGLFMNLARGNQLGPKSVMCTMIVRQERVSKDGKTPYSMLDDSHANLDLDETLRNLQGFDIKKVSVDSGMYSFDSCKTMETSGLTKIDLYSIEDEGLTANLNCYGMNDDGTTGISIDELKQILNVYGMDIGERTETKKEDTTPVNPEVKIIHNGIEHIQDTNAKDPIVKDEPVVTHNENDQGTKIVEPVVKPVKPEERKPAPVVNAGE